MAMVQMTPAAQMTPEQYFAQVADWATPHLGTDVNFKLYLNIPSDALARFSTHNGTRPKRPLVEPLPARIVRSDVGTEISRVANLVRQRLPPDTVLQIQVAENWDDLYDYFDAVDLWVETPAFLFYVINLIAAENHGERYRQAQAQKAALQVVPAVAIRRVSREHIHDFAAGWVEANFERIANAPFQMNLLNFLNPADEQFLTGFSNEEIDWMRHALREHCERFRSTEPRTHNTKAMHAIPHPHQGMPQPFTPIMQQPVVASHFPVVTRGEQFQSTMMPVHPVHPQSQNFQQFMYNQQMLHDSQPAPAPPIGSGNFHTENNDFQNGPRARGYSNGRNQQKYNNFSHQIRSSFNERRMIPNPPLRSPQHKSSQINQRATDCPIYVHNSQRVPPSNGADQPTTANLVVAHNTSESFQARMGYSNDARVSCSSRQHQSAREPQDKSAPTPLADLPRRNSTFSGTGPNSGGPFQNDPNAKVGPKSTTYYYNTEFKNKGRSDFHSTRTIYVRGISVDDFASHKLKEIMSEVGTVDLISFINHPFGNTAFVAFQEENAVQLGIDKLGGRVMESGEPLVVRLPDNNDRYRERSGSQSSQNYFSNYQRRPIANRKQSVSQFDQCSGSFRSQPHSPETNRKQLSSQYDPGTGPFGSQSHSPEHQSRFISPLTEGFLTQLSISQRTAPPQYAVTCPEPLASSVLEVLNKQVALDQMVPLNAMSGNTPHKKAAGHSEAITKKENSPAKSKNTTPMNTPKKVSQSGEKNQKGKKGKKNSKKNISNYPTPAVSPVASRSAVDLTKLSPPATSFRQSAAHGHTYFLDMTPTKAYSSDELANMIHQTILTTPPQPFNLKKLDEQLNVAEKAKVQTQSVVESKAKGEDSAAEASNTSEPKADNKQHASDYTEHTDIILVHSDVSSPLVDSNNQALGYTDLVRESPAKPTSTPVMIETPGELNSPTPSAKCRTLSSGSRTLSTESHEGSPSNYDSFKRKKPNKGKGKKTHALKANTVETAEQLFDTSHLTISPVSTTTEYKSADTSFSSRNPSFASAQSDTTWSNTATPILTSASISASTSLSEKRTEGDGARSAITTTFMSTSAEMSQSDKKGDNETRSATPTPFPKHAKAGSNASASSVSTPKSRKAQKHRSASHVKNQSNASELSNSSQRKADVKSEKQSDENSKPVTIIDSTKCSNDNDTKMSVQEAPEQWPALGPSKVPMSTLIGGKAPAIPAPKSISECNASRDHRHSNVVVPAVPLNMIASQRRRSATTDTNCSYDSNNSAATDDPWPRVLRVRPK